jgi:exoribonuclease-2
VLKDGLVRADKLPLVFKALGCDALPRVTHVRVRLTGSDLLTLDLHATLLTRLDEPAQAPSVDEEADDEAEAAAPLALAIDVGDASDGESAAGNADAPSGPAA